VARIDEDWPRAEGTTNAVVVLSMRALPDVPSSVTIKAMRRWAGQLAANDGRLIISGVDAATAEMLRRGGLDDLLGDDGIVPSSDRIFGPLDEAVERGRAWVAAQGGGSGDSPQRDSN
jgi:SulP family sulfate permease